MARILLVDDERQWYILMVKVLAGHALEWAQTAQAATRMMAQQPFDIVLLDGMLPGSLQGPTLVPLLRLHAEQMGFPVPAIIGLTGYPHLANEFEQVGVPVLLKGIGILELRRMIEDLAPPPQTEPYFADEAS